MRAPCPTSSRPSGRALRTQPGEGKVASLVVPVLLGPGETADNMSQPAVVGFTAKLLSA
ncbi:hypothetical protein LT493_26425 [Streptomyces tricolor]|nr:hypothetical protein [Streptomyces tricolor]